MSDKILTRMGDGERITMSAGEIREELAEGMQDAATKGKVPELSDNEIEQMLEIIAEPGRVVSVPPGEEIIVTDDGCAKVFSAGPADGGPVLPISRQNAVMAYERSFAADTLNFGWEDYSFKPAKAAIDCETQTYFTASHVTTAPLYYGSQPNLGLYFQPDGAHENPADLLPMGKIDEARASQEAAAEQLREDMVFVGKRLAEVGCEGLNFDTAGSTGDADFYATLLAVEELKKKYPAMSIEVGMSSEFVLGMHGQLTYDGKRLAGMYPHDQAAVVEAAGAEIFGPAVNTNSSKTFAWNLARAVTLCKYCSEVSALPVHPNVGMGVCGVPMALETPIDCVTRTTKALVMIGKADGLQLGVGDAFGIPIAHIMAGGMGGIRTAGDLVAWMQMTRKMKIAEAKQYVADKLGVSIIDLSDEDVMFNLRAELGIGIVTGDPGKPYGILAKSKIAQLLDIEINSVNLFKSMM